MGNIDRRILYLIALLVMALPLFLKVPLPVAKNARSLELYNRIEAVDQSKGGNLILLCANFSYDTQGESLAQAKALIRHMLTRGKKFAILAFNQTTPAGQEIANNAAKDVAKDLDAQGIHRVYGTDWVNFGFHVADAPVMEGFSKDIPGFVKTDSPGGAAGKPIASFPAMRGVHSAKDLALVIDVAAASTYETLMPALTQKYNVPLALAPTSVFVPDTYPFLKSGQVKGELRGVLGAAEYESLNNKPELGTKVMTSIAAVNAYIILLIIIGNVSYFRSRRAEEAAR